MLERLPDEVLDVVFETVPPKQLIDLQLCCRWLSMTVRASALAMYRIECWAAGVCDDLRPDMSYSERRDSLKRREEDWLHLNWGKGIRLEVPFRAKSWPEGTKLNSGFIVFPTKPTRDLPHRLAVTTLDKDPKKPLWRIWESDVAILYAMKHMHQDLLVVLYEAAHDEDEANSTEMIPGLDICLFSASTGEPHSSAQVPVIELVLESPATWKLGFKVEVLGDRMFVFVCNGPILENETVKDKLYIINWKTGKTELSVGFHADTYSDLVMISDTLIMFPNKHAFALDVHLLVTTSSGSIFLVQGPSLQLPTCKKELPRPDAIRCRADPIVGVDEHAAAKPSSADFLDCPDDAIVVCDFDFEREYELGQFIVHRKTILAAVSAFMRKYDKTEYAVSYDEWAAGKCFWTSTGKNWLAHSAGQRFVLPAEDDDDDDDDNNALAFSLLNFNPYTFYRLRDGLGRSPQGGSRQVTCEQDLYVDSFMFDEPVACGLPYVKTTFTADSYETKGFMMDNNHMVAIEVGAFWIAGIRGLVARTIGHEEGAGV